MVGRYSFSPIKVSSLIREKAWSTGRGRSCYRSYIQTELVGECSGIVKGIFWKREHVNQVLEKGKGNTVGRVEQSRLEQSYEQHRVNSMSAHILMNMGMVKRTVD